MDNFTFFSMPEVNRYETIKRLIDGHITEEEARKQIGLKSVRQVRRIKERVEREGIKGVLHRGKGKTSNRKISEEVVKESVELIKAKYIDFKPTFANEKLKEVHGIELSKETVRKLMIEEGIWKPKPRKKPSKRHTWRPRKENRGEMEQFDGCYHHWFEERGGEECLLLAIDDADGTITKAKFDDHEGVMPVFDFWREYIETNGIPLSIYLDKFSTYKINHPSAQDNADLMTQFQRAMKELGVRVIFAHSPQAKGRVERSFFTLQDRLVKELRLHNISTKEEANKFLEEQFIPAFNKKFSVVPTNEADLHKTLSDETKAKLLHIFSIQNERKVQNDFTILYKTRFFQLEELQPTTVYKKDTVIVAESRNGIIQISLKNHFLKFTELPERPKKQNLPIVAITRRKSGWIPPQNHPWRKYTIKDVLVPA